MQVGAQTAQVDETGFMLFQRLVNIHCWLTLLFVKVYAIYPSAEFDSAL
jgi:hypothetical protein